MRIFLTLAIILGVAAGGAAYYYKHVAVQSAVYYRTATITRGDVVSVISATGTLQPEEVIDVGAQVAGRIESFGPDLDHPGKTVDFNTIVRKGQVLAVIDPTTYQAQVERAEAELESAEASLQQMIAKCEQAKLEWQRAERLKPTKAIADTDYDTALANYKIAEANVAAARAAVRQAKAALEVAKTNLGYTVIKSPVDGAVIARRVNIGQTVVASLNAPSIFLIAKDLRRMQVWASVNEADIGRIRLGMPVHFTVDAFPEETFHGTVTQIRMNAQMTQNVVTYTVIVTTENPKLRLLPYLTANVLFEVERKENVLLVPNAALRWKPVKNMTSDTIAEEAEKRTSSDERKETSRLWVLEGDVVRPIVVETGLSDGLVTEVSGAEVKEGLEVIVGVDTNNVNKSAQGTTNPFLPKMPPGMRRMPPPG